MSLASDETTSPGVEPFDGLEVASVSADTLRAGIRVTGSITASTVSLLTSVLRTHTCAGRRYLRVDLTAARVEPGALESLVAAHRRIAELGGMLVLENAGPLVIDAIRDDRLFVRAAD